MEDCLELQAGDGGRRGLEQFVTSTIITSIGHHYCLDRIVIRSRSVFGVVVFTDCERASVIVNSTT